MISVRINPISKPAGVHEALSTAFGNKGFAIPVEKIASYLATVLISRVRKSFLKQQNPDGKSWKMSKAAAKRLAGGFTYAKGGAFAPGGRKTGGGILFSSGNLFHSIQLAFLGVGAFSIRTDVPYARYYMNEDRTIIGTTEQEITTLATTILERMI